jgi:hypothetical protein
MLAASRGCQQAVLKSMQEDTLFESVADSAHRREHHHTNRDTTVRR